MYIISKTKRFERDVKTCQKRHWDLNAFKLAISNLANSDAIPLDKKYHDHALTGNLAGMRSIHIPSTSNPPKDTWILLYEIAEGELYLYRTGTHDELLR